MSNDTNPDAISLAVRGRALAPRLPAMFGAASRDARGGDGAGDPFLPPNYLRARSTTDLAPAARGEWTEEQTHRAADDEVLVLELADGGVLVTHPANLREALQRSHPEVVGDGGTLHLDRLRAGGAGTSRGLGSSLGSLVQRVFTFAAGEGKARDAIIDKALEKVADPLLLGVSWAGTKALMWAIEERLEQPAGSLRRWDGGTGFGTPPAGGGGGGGGGGSGGSSGGSGAEPMLVFVHGTASSTRGSFGDLRESDPALWRSLERRFTGGIYAFEHRTLSESPIDNALQLVAALPTGARVSLVSHSRGGLVADLLCLDGADTTGLATCIARYRYPFARTGTADAAESERVRRELDAAHAAQREQLTQLGALLRERSLAIERYVRVASPARGTRLAGGNFDVFISGLLTLIGQIPVLRASFAYNAFKRVVVEIAKNRTRPHMVPGIEAMLPDSPMAGLLRAGPARRQVEMAVIAGDIDGGGLLQRLGTLLTDTLFFDREDNDLVVDTAAMMGGVAEHAGARVLFDRGAEVSHFNYFANPRTRQALADWLLGGPGAAGAAVFKPLAAPAENFAPAPSRRDGVPDTRPVVVLLPGVMGSHLALADPKKAGELDRIWLDPLDIAKGGLKSLAWGKPNVQAEELFSLFYGKLANRLQATHDVRRFPYDWRQPLDVLADRLAALLVPLLDATEGRPVRLLAHSMGGLVVRAAIHKHSPVMDRLMARPGARLVMCGTPHQGAHSMVENLIGKGDTLRTLVRLDLANDMQEVLDIVAGFRGALALLPKPGFVDTFQGQTEGAGTPVGGEFFDYHSAATWADFRPRVTDRWFGDGKVGQPAQETLEAAAWLWRQDGRDTPALPAAYTPNTIYVAGVAAHTPCGVLHDAKGQLRMVATTRGDGTVTWDSGRIKGIGSFYYLPAAHGDLLAKSEHFDALIELLAEGRTARLPTAPPVTRALEAEAPTRYDAGPPVVADADAVARMAVGASVEERVAPQGQRELRISVRADDLRFVRSPVLVGHYQDDPIAGAQALIDREVMAGQLRERHELGLYAGPLGSATVVLLPADATGQRGGVVVAGLGRYDGTLTAGHLTEAVRTAALRYLLHAADVIGRDKPVPPLAALLLGQNSNTHISIAASVEALVRGVIEANRRFAETTRSTSQIAQLDIVELYRDTAISAFYALRELHERLNEVAAASGHTLVMADTLVQGEGVRQRLYDRAGDGYWPNLFVTGIDADADPAAAPAARSEGERAAGRPTRRLADRLRFLFVGQRARAEAVMQQRQPGVLEELVRRQIHVRSWQPDFGRTLFQLTVPHEFKDTLRQTPRAVLVVDETTANLPWELLLADDPARGAAAAATDAQPLAQRMALVRRFQSDRFRPQVRQSTGRAALVIGNPSCEGFAEAFPAPAGAKATLPPPKLDGAEQEAEAVAARLHGLGYEVQRAIGEDQTADAVLVQLYRRPWRVLHIAAHGVFDVVHRDGLSRSGVVLSGGFLITAAEVRAMESVPELVFLNCCHLGQVDARHEAPLREPNRLAASVARELIDIGVRCVVVAGWAVTDTLAERFGSVFYDELLSGRASFGEAVHEARKALWALDPDDITWGAFQAYGDPDWRPERSRGGGGRPDGYFASPEEVLDALSSLRVAMSRRDDAPTPPEREERRRAVELLFERRCRPEWRGRAELQSALGATWYSLGEFARARDAYLAALAASGPRGVVPVHDIERLANAEARMVAQTEDPALADLPLLRLEMLDRATADLLKPVRASSEERSALLGSAWKIKADACAARMLRTHGGDAELRRGFIEALREASAAYGSVEGRPGQPDFKPYPALNRLALDAVRGFPDAAARSAAVEVARACATVARKGLEEHFDVWSAIMVPDAALTEHVIDGRLAAPGEPGRQAAHAVRDGYRSVLERTPIKPVELDSILGQMRKTSRLWRGIAHVEPTRASEARRLAARLEWLGDVLGRRQPSDTPAPLDAPASAAAAGTRRRSTTAPSAPAVPPPAPTPPAPRPGRSAGAAQRSGTRAAAPASTRPRKTSAKR
ncbi:MAG: CHAT domain-containing protein [Rubrivivax sp.]|nr:CHAT domain-containing protein [Rubrivivax sp.]